MKWQIEEVIIWLFSVDTRILYFFDHSQNHIDEAMEMYQEMHMWDEAIEVAEAKVGPTLGVYNYLEETVRRFLLYVKLLFVPFCFSSQLD